MEAIAPVRYVRLRADTLMGMFRELGEPARAQALAALARSTATHGGDSARRALHACGGDRAALLEAIAKTAGELGWGQWRFMREGARLALAVDDSPFAEAHGPAASGVCAPIAGMFEAVAALVEGAPCEAREVACRATGADACRFESTTRALR